MTRLKIVRKIRIRLIREQIRELGRLEQGSKFFCKVFSVELSKQRKRSEISWYM